MRQLGVVLLLWLGVATCAVAQIEDQMQTMFGDLGSMSNFTKPGVFQSAHGGMISGGSVQIRNRVVSFPRLVNFEPPRLKGAGGCGGIDLVFGSLSFVSKEQLIEYAKSLASNAATYAFDLGLRGLCPQCQAEMEKLTGYTNQLNIWQKNSCEAAQQLVGASGMKDWADRRYNEYLGSSNGQDSDSLENGKNGPGKENPISSLARTNPQLAKQIVQGNIVWRAVKKSNLASRIPGGNDELLQDLVSFVGTRIVCIPGDPEGCAAKGQDPDREGTPEITAIEHSLSLEDLLNGSRAGSKVYVLRCVGSTSETGCLKMEKKELTNFKGFAQRLRDFYLGSANDLSSTGGLIGRMLYSRGERPSDQDQAYFIAYGAYGSLTERLARRSELEGRSFADKFATAVAARYLQKYLHDVLDAVASAIADTKADSTGTLGPVVQEAFDRLNEDSVRLGMTPDLETTMINYASAIESGMGMARLPLAPQLTKQ